MQRLCTERACTYSGRSVRRSGVAFVCTVVNQMGPLVEQDPGAWEGCHPTRANEAANGAKRRSALRSNAWRDWTEVSRGRMSHHPQARRGRAKGRTRMDKEER
jgi:hypothetical protein